MPVALHNAEDKLQSMFHLQAQDILVLINHGDCYGSA